MKTAFFFRKPSPVFHSIEEQFFAMQKELPKDVECSNIFAAYHSKGLFKRILITIQSAFNQGEINHITGDIHFVALFLKKRKTILTVHDIGSVLKGGGIKNKVLRFFWFTMPFARVKYITVISDFTKTEILQNFNINPQKIIVIPDCVSEEIKYTPKEFNKEKPNILQIGTKSNKNLENLIPALNGINCTLTIIGKLSDKQKEQLKTNNIDYDNKYNLSFPEIINEYKNTDIVTFISTYEGFGVPILEAQATGRPVITSNLSPMKEVAGEGALLINPNDITSIKNGIQSLIKNEPQKQTLIKKGQENVKNYTAKSIAAQYHNLYKTIITKS